MKCWNCNAEQNLSNQGKCMICRKDVGIGSEGAEKPVTIFCEYHWDLSHDYRNHLIELANIFGIKALFLGEPDGIRRFIDQGGFEDLKKKFQQAYQDLREDSTVWKEIYDEEITKVRVKLAQWIEKVKPRLN